MSKPTGRATIFSKIVINDGKSCYDACQLVMNLCKMKRNVKGKITDPNIPENVKRFFVGKSFKFEIRCRILMNLLAEFDVTKGVVLELSVY